MLLGLQGEVVVVILILLLESEQVGHQPVDVLGVLVVGRVGTENVILKVFVLRHNAEERSDAVQVVNVHLGLVLPEKLEKSVGRSVSLSLLQRGEVSVDILLNSKGVGKAKLVHLVGEGRGRVETGVAENPFGSEVLEVVVQTEERLAKAHASLNFLIVCGVNLLEELICYYSRHKLVSK